MTRMAMDFQQLACQVRDEIDSYVVPAPHPDQLGTPLPPEWYGGRLLEMRDALVEPYNQEVADHQLRLIPDDACNAGRTPGRESSARQVNQHMS